MTEEAAAGAASSPGAKLRRAREARNWTAAQAAELMRLPVSVVDALEQDRYADLGAAVFARGHLRRYATLLDLPADPLLDAYDRSHAGPAPPSLIPQASAHTPVRAEGERLRLPPAAWYALGLALVLAAAAGGWWWWNERRPAEPSPVIAPAAEPATVEQDVGDDAVPGPAEASAMPGSIPEAAPPPEAAAEAP
jgi:cytoskeleton protein RodZ